MLQHFHRVARDMNNYVAASAYNYYNQPRRDRGLVMYQASPSTSGGLGGLIAYGLYSIGMPSSIVTYGYRLGYFFDSL